MTKEITITLTEAEAVALYRHFNHAWIWGQHNDSIRLKAALALVTRTSPDAKSKKYDKTDNLVACNAIDFEVL